MFQKDSYICFDLPEPMATTIMNIRISQADDFRMQLPAEITVAGSSGIGLIARDEDPDKVFAILKEICSQTEPMTLQFKQVDRFPNSDVFVMRLVDESPLKAFQARLAQSGIRFEPVAFDVYTPHCTLRSRSPVTDEEAADLLALQLSDPFTIAKLSIYRMDQLPMTHLIELGLGK